MSIRSLVVLVFCALWTVHSAPVEKVEPAKEKAKVNYTIALPKTVITSTDHKVYVDIEQKNVVVRIDSRELNSNKTVQGAPTLFKTGNGEMTYRLPFNNYVKAGVQLNVTIFSCLKDAEDCLAKLGPVLASESVDLPVQKNGIMIFMQTDKPIYKPGETVKFRALPIFINSLKPTRDDKGQTGLKFDLIYIEAPNKNRISQWRDTTYEVVLKGLSFDLLKDPVLGKWKIVSQVGNLKDQHEFEVKPYVLPKFTVDIKAPTFVFIEDKTVKFEVCAKYSTGMPMKAIIKTQFCIVRKYTYRYRQRRYKTRPCITKKVQTSGTKACTKFVLSTKILGLKSKDYYTYNLVSQIKATVNEKGTQQTIRKTVRGGEVTTRPFKFVDLSPKYFASGLPFYGMLRTENNDGSVRPFTTVVVRVTSFWGYGWGYHENLSSDENGIVNFQIPPFPGDETSVSIIASGKMIENRNRWTSKYIEPSNPNIYINIRRKYSPSKTFLQVYPLSRMAAQDPCSSGKLKLQLQSNVPIHEKEIKVVGMSRGDISFIQNIQPDKNALGACKDVDSSEMGHYTCTENPNKVRCLEGWSGTNCLTPVCHQGCVKGVCRQPGVCKCRKGWIGEACNECKPRKGCDKGCCFYGDDCRCFPGYKGFLCNKSHTPKTSRRPACAKKMVVNTTTPYNPDQLEDRRIFSRNVEIAIPSSTFPSAKLAIWFTHDSPNQTEFVTTSQTLSDLKSCLDKEVPTSFKFEREVAGPGEKISAKITTTGKNAKCALSLSDVALETFGSSGGVSLGELQKEIDKFVNQLTGWHSIDPYRELQNDYCRPILILKDSSRRQRRMIMPWRPQAADSSQVFKDAGVFVLSNTRIITSPCIQRKTIMYMARGRGQPMEEAGAAVPMLASRNLKKKPPGKISKDALKARVRTFFPESWKFELLENPSTIPLTVPDSLTSWKADMFCVSSLGLGIAPSSKLIVFTPFYLQISLPYSVIRGETARIPVKVFNYLTTCTEIEVSMKPSSDLDSNGVQLVKQCLCHMDQATVHFRVKPKRLGKVPIQVYAVSRPSTKCSKGVKSPNEKTYADSVKRSLLVEPEGVTEELTFGDVICPSNESASAEFDLKTPDKANVVKDSARAYVSWSGNILGSSLEHLDRMVKMPYGCGEQNMMSLVPSIYILDFFTEAGISKPNIAAKARKYIEIGYRRQLKYRLENGSFSAFGSRDRVGGSTWLTTFVFKSFVAAKKYDSNIEDKVLKTALQFLMSKVEEDGCFREDGRVFSSSLKGGLRNAKDTVSITAYVLSALAEAEESDPKLANATRAGKMAALKCLSTYTNATTIESLSTYAIAVRNYALRGSEDVELRKLYQEELKRRTVKKDGFVYWPNTDKERSESSRRWQYYFSADIETTAYVLLSKLDTVKQGSDLMKVLPTVRWLTSLRNEYGGWYSTQDTIIALQALSKLASRITLGTGSPDAELTIAMKDKTRKYMVNKENRLVVSKLPAQLPGMVTFTAKGRACVLVQANVIFNVKDIGRDGAPFEIFGKAVHKKGCQTATVNVCARYTGKSMESGMSVINVKMASGWEVAPGETRRLRSGDVSRADIEADKSLVLYFHSFTSSNSCVSFEVQQKVQVNPLLPMLVEIYDYYNPDERQEVGVQLMTGTCATKDPSADPKCPLCPAKDKIEMAITKMCSKVNYFAGFSKMDEGTSGRVTQRVGDMIMVWTAKLKLPDTCECQVAERSLVAVEKEWYRLAMDEDIQLNSLWTVLNMTGLSSEDVKLIDKSCLVNNTAFGFIYRMWKPKFEETEKKKKLKPIMLMDDESSKRGPPPGVIIEPPEMMCPWCPEDISPDDGNRLRNDLKNKKYELFKVVQMETEGGTTWEITAANGTKVGSKSVVYRHCKPSCEFQKKNESSIQLVVLSKQKWKMRQSVVKPDGDFTIGEAGIMLRILFPMPSPPIPPNPPKLMKDDSIFGPQILPPESMCPACYNKDEAGSYKDIVCNSNEPVIGTIERKTGKLHLQRAKGTSQTIKMISDCSCPGLKVGESVAVFSSKKLKLKGKSIALDGDAMVASSSEGKSLKKSLCAKKDAITEA